MKKENKEKTPHSSLNPNENILSPIIINKVIFFYLNDIKANIINIDVKYSFDYAGRDFDKTIIQIKVNFFIHLADFEIGKNYMSNLTTQELLKDFRKLLIKEINLKLKQVEYGN